MKHLQYFTPTTLEAMYNDLSEALDSENLTYYKASELGFCRMDIARQYRALTGDDLSQSVADVEQPN